MKEHYLRHKERLRTRYAQSGLDGFHDYEVLELILSYSLVRKDTKELAKKLIKHFGSIACVFNASIEELCKFKGISTRTAVLLKIVKDSATFMLLDKIKKQRNVTTSEDLYDYLIAHYKGEKIETFLAIYLNTQHMIISIEKITDGSANQARVPIRQVVDDALRKGAASVVVVHNHPGGTLVVSEEDKKVTRRLKEALTLVEVNLLDHIIIADNAYISMHDSNLL